MEEKQKAEKTDSKEAKLVEVPSAYGIAIELEDGRKVDEVELLVIVYNKLLKIEKSVA